MAHIELDNQQMKAVSAEADRVLIDAPPGSGKTAILTRIAQDNAGKRILYITFSKAMAIDAKGKLPPHVDVMTFHAMTNRIMRSRFGHKFRPADLKPKELVDYLGMEDHLLPLATLTLAGLQKFYQSKAEVPGERHLVAADDYEPGDRIKIVRAMRMTWDRMKDPNHPLPVSHDSLAKLFHVLWVTLPYDLILFDEAQDATESMLDSLRQQTARVVLVGDPYQSIYDFRGAVGHFSLFFPEGQRVVMSNSYRFGETIASTAEAIINAGKPGHHRIVGKGDPGGFAVYPGYLVTDPGHAVLFRTNASVFSFADEYLTSNPEAKIHLLGGPKSYNLYDAMQLYHLAVGNRRWVHDPLLLSLGSVEAVEEYAQRYENQEIIARIRLFKQYGAKLPELSQKLAACHTDNADEASLVVGNVHKAKGMEFDAVTIGNDFPNPCSGKELSEEERNVLYVATTRSKSALLLTEALDDLLTAYQTA